MGSQEHGHSLSFGLSLETIIQLRAATSEEDYFLATSLTQAVSGTHEDPTRVDSAPLGKFS